MRLIAIGMLALTFTASAAAWPTGQKLRSLVYKTDSCLARIIDRENGSWDPTISFHGGHNPNDSYGLPQAMPGTKMRSAGEDWRTNPFTQLRWMRTYTRERYGGPCEALAFWNRKGWY